MARDVAEDSEAGLAKDAAPESASRVEWVDAAKGLSILLVVAHHVVSYVQFAGWAPGPVVAVNEALASLRMPLFFLAAGLFVAGPLAAPWRTLLHKRVAFFLYLYLLWTLVRFTFFATLVPPGVDPNTSADPAGLVWALLMPGPSMWFLYALALFSLLGKLLRWVPGWAQLAVAGVISALSGAGLLELDSRWDYLARFWVFFLVGWHARAVIEQVARATSLVTVIAGSGVCVLAAAGAQLLDLRSVPPVALLLNCLAVTFGVVFCAWLVRFRIATPLVTLGQQTLPVYLVHMLWLAAIMTAVRPIQPSAAVGYLAPLVLAVAVIALSLGTQWVLVRVGAPWLFALPRPLAYRAPGRHVAPA